MGILGRLFRRPKTLREQAREDASPWIDPRVYNLLVQNASLRMYVDRTVRARGGNLDERVGDDRMVFVARGLLKYNTYARGFIAGLRTYTLGSKGLRSFATGKNEKTLNEFLTYFKDQHDWWSRERELYERVHVDGEALIRYYPTDDCVTLRMIEPEWLVPPDGTEEWTYGVKNAKGDAETVEAYSVMYGSEREIVDASDVYHIKSKMLPRVVKRGQSDFLAAAQLFDSAFKTWRNFGDSEAVRQGIIYFAKQAEGVTGSDLEAAIAAEADYRPPSAATSNPPAFKSQHGTGVEYLQAGTELAAVPGAENVQGTIAGTNAALLAASREYNMPLFLVSGDMNSNNTLDLSDESPFGAAIADEQHWFSRHVRNVLLKVVDVAVAEGHLPYDVLDGTDITVEPERRPAADVIAATTRLKTLEDDGVISKRTRTTHEGFDYEAEQAQRQEDGDREPAPKEPVRAKLRIGG